MALITTAPITVEEFERMPDPEQPGKQELLNGELIQLPPAKLAHDAISKLLYHHILGTVALSRVEKEVGYQMPPYNWLVPDISVRWPDQQISNGYLQGAPMIAVEIVSPGNSAEEIQAKVVTYLGHGAAEVWIIYPRTQAMMVHTPSKTERITDTYTCEIVPVVVNLSDLLR